FLYFIFYHFKIRQFSNKEIPKNIIVQILQAGKFTHTAKNSQDVSYVVLDNKKEIIQQYAVNLFRKIKPFVGLFNSAVKRYSIDDNFFFFKGNVVIVIISKSEINGALAAQNMEFVAQANGLGVLYSGFFSIAANTSRKIKKELSISKSEKVITTLVLGYPNVEYYRCAQREDIKVKYM
ncbi:MAG: nitroreductase family protein, partial [Oscillospiraceae bacterium]